MSRNELWRKGMHTVAPATVLLHELTGGGDVRAGVVASRRPIAFDDQDDICRMQGNFRRVAVSDVQPREQFLLVTVDVITRARGDRLGAIHRRASRSIHAEKRRWGGRP